MSTPQQPPGYDLPLLRWKHSLLWLLLSLGSVAWISLTSGCFSIPNFQGFGCTTDTDCVNLQCLGGICQGPGGVETQPKEDVPEPVVDAQEGPSEKEPGEGPPEVPDATEPPGDGQVQELPPEPPQERAPPDGPPCVPETELCGNGKDDNCDGQIDEGCTWGAHSEADGEERGHRIVRIKQRDGKGLVMVAGTFAGKATLGSSTQISPVVGGVRQRWAYVAGFAADTGHFLWVHWLTSGSGSVDIYDMRRNAAGDVFLYGSFTPTLLYPGPDGKLETLRPKGLNNKPFNGGFLARLNDKGHFVWNTPLGGSGVFCQLSVGKTRCMGIDPTSGAIYIGGAFISPAVFGSFPTGATQGTYDSFVLRADHKSGKVQKFIQISGTSRELITAVAVSPAGNVFAFGTTTGKLDVATATGPRSIQEGTFLLRISPQGLIEELVRVGDQVDPRAAVASKDGLFLVGSILNTKIYKTKTFAGKSVSGNGFRDIFLVRFDHKGAHGWSHFLHATGPKDTAMSVFLADEAGEALYVTGSFRGPLVMGTKKLQGGGILDHGFWARLDGKDGRFTHAASFSGGAEVLPADIFLDADKYLYITGTFSQGNLQFLGLTLNNNKADDMFALRFRISETPP